MSRPLRVLIVEDSDDDVEMLVRVLERDGYDVTYERVQTAEEMQAALGRSSWHAVISDYSLPSFSGPEALEVLKSTRKDLPFIIVSGTIGEDTAVAALKAGAHDFLVKGHLARLVPAIDREIRDASQRRERMLAQEALIQSEQQLRHAQKMEAIGRLAGGIAHDFNNLLTAILGYTDLLLDRVRDQPDLTAELTEIRKASQRASELTRQLLAFSRKQALQPQILNLNATVSELERMLRRVIGEDIQLQTATAASPAWVKADAGQMEQVLMNLAVNARDAMPLGGTLTIETGNAVLPSQLVPLQPDTRPGIYVSLTVRDTGTGMSPEVRSRIFEPFFTTKGSDKGTGLGLSMVYGIVTQSGGHITVDSERNRGTAFTVYLPAVESAAASVPAPLQPITSVAGTETILLVEDEAGIRELVRKVLQRQGYTVLATGNATEALEACDQHSGEIHLLVSDIVMPGGNGPDLAQRVIARRPGLRVLYISGYPNLAIEIGSMSDSTQFLPKPFTPAAIARKVRECLNSPRDPTAS
jgi:two-component system cell cycle sensor histidine kinase/response regulator CckA